MFKYFGILKGLLIQNEVDRTKQLIVEISPSATTGTTTTLVAAQTANRTINLPDSNFDFNAVITASSTTTLTNKTIDGDNNTIQDLALTSLKTVLADASKFLVRDASGIVVSNTKAVPTGVVVGTTDSQTLTNKSIDADANIITNIENADIKALAAIALTKLAAVTANRVLQSDASGFVSASAVTNTTLGFLDATSSIQTQLNAKVDDTDVIAIAQGGTGQTTAANAINALLPTQTGHSGEFLTTNGTVASWGATTGGANQTLSNLTDPTAINQSLIFDSGATRSVKTQDGTNSDAIIFGSGLVAGGASGDVTLTSGGSASSATATGKVSIITGFPNTGTGVSGNIDILTGPTINGNSGTILLNPGTAGGGGTRGTIRFVDGSEGTVNYLWMSTDVTGKGHWSNQIVIQSGNTASRPGTPVTGQTYFDTTLTKPIWYSGTNWVDATGTPV